MFLGGFSIKHAGVVPDLRVCRFAGHEREKAPYPVSRGCIDSRVGGGARRRIAPAASGPPGRFRVFPRENGKDRSECTTAGPFARTFDAKVGECTSGGAPESYIGREKWQIRAVFRG